jgi:hypothetical protein
MSANGRASDATPIWRLSVLGRNGRLFHLRRTVVHHSYRGVASAGKQLGDGLNHLTLALETLRVLNQLLIVLMLVEILHTVRISIRSHFLVTEPFLVIGLIASIRRMLVITPEMSSRSKDGH